MSKQGCEHLKTSKNVLFLKNFTLLWPFFLRSKITRRNRTFQHAIKSLPLLFNMHHQNTKLQSQNSFIKFFFTYFQSGYSNILSLKLALKFTQKFQDVTPGRIIQFLGSLQKKQIQNQLFDLTIKISLNGT